MSGWVLSSVEAVFKRRDIYVASGRTKAVGMQQQYGRFDVTTVKTMRLVTCPVPITYAPRISL